MGKKSQTDVKLDEAIEKIEKEMEEIRTYYDRLSIQHQTLTDLKNITIFPEVKEEVKGDTKAV